MELRGFLMAFPPFLFLFFMNAREYIAGGPHFPDQGAAFSSQLCVSLAKLLLLKCNHSNLLLRFPIERISSLFFPEWNRWLLAAWAGVPHLLLCVCRPPILSCL